MLFRSPCIEVLLCSVHKYLQLLQLLGLIKGSIQEEDITIVNIYSPNIGAPQYIRQMLTAKKGEIHSNTIIVGDFNSPLSPMDRSFNMKINKESTSLK